VARSVVLPNLNSELSEVVERVNLRVLGVRTASPVPGFAIPSVVGPFNYFDLRARLSQTVADVTAWNNYRASVETGRASQAVLPYRQTGKGGSAAGCFSSGTAVTGRFSSKSNEGGCDMAGTYRVIGYTLELYCDYGKVEHLLAFYPEPADRSIYLRDAAFSSPKN
jgi:hypothetical protein